MKNHLNFLRVGSHTSADHLDAAHKAALAGDSDKLATLLGNNPFLLTSTTKDADRYTLMHEAALGEHPALVSYLLHQGGVSMLQAIDSKGRTPVHIAAGLASSNIIFEMLSQAGNLAKQLLTTHDSKGMLPIHHAASEGRTEIIHLITQLAGKEMLMAQDFDGNTPFHKVAARGHLACVKNLLSDESNKGLINFANLAGGLPVHAAAANGNVMVIQYLVRKGSATQLTARDLVGKQLLHFAAGAGHLNVIAYIVSKLGPDALGAVDDVAQTPLFYAAVGGHLSVTQYIVFRMGMSAVLLKDKEGRLASDIAAEEPKKFLQQVRDWFIKELEMADMENNIDKDQQLDDNARKKQTGEKKGPQRSGAERLAEAISAGDVAEVKALIEEDPQLLRQTNGYGDQPLMAAAFSGALEICQMMVQQAGPELLRMRNDDGETPLHIAVSQDHEKVIRWMVQVGGKELLRLKTTDGEIPLGYAVMRNSIPTASLLLEEDGQEQLEAKNVNGSTVLAAANSVVMKDFLAQKLQDLKEPKSGRGPHEQVAVPPRRSSITARMRQAPVVPEA